MPNGRKPGWRPPPEPKKERRPRMSLEQRRVLRAERKAAQEPGYIPVPPEKPHVPKIMDPDPNIFPPKLRRVLQYYLDTWPRDLDKAARAAWMLPDEFREHLKSPGVKEYLRREEEKIDEKAADRRAEARVLTEDHLDAMTVGILENPTIPPAQKVRMIEVGYRRFGMLKDRVEATGAGGAPLAFELIRIGQKKEHDGDSGDSSI